jgi:hypothetical protein
MPDLTKHDYDWMIFRLAFWWTPLTQGEADAIRAGSLSGSPFLVIFPLIMVVCGVGTAFSANSLWLFLLGTMPGLFSLPVLIGTIRWTVLKIKMTSFGQNESAGHAG